MNTIALITAMYKRPELTQFVFNYYKEMKSKLENFVNLELFVSGSEGVKSRNLAEGNGFNYIEIPNFPLTSKFNKVAQESKKSNPDAVLLIGSDDIISYDTFMFYDGLINKGFDCFGFLDMYVFDLLSQKLYYWIGYTNKRKGESIGLGRLYSKKVMDKLSWNLWDKNFNQNLDGINKRLLSRNNIKVETSSLKSSNSFVLDIKTKNNITHIKNYLKNDPNCLIEQNLTGKFENIFIELKKIQEI